MDFLAKLNFSPLILLEISRRATTSEPKTLISFFGLSVHNTSICYSARLETSTIFCSDSKLKSRYSFKFNSSSSFLKLFGKASSSL